MWHHISLHSVWVVCLSVFLGDFMAGVAPAALKRSPTSSAVVSKEERANPLESDDRYMPKKWYEEGNGDNNNLLLTAPQQPAFMDIQSPDVPPTGFRFGHGLGAAAPFLPDKWSDLFLAQQQRSFLPSSYGPSMGVEKRRPSDYKQQQFLDNYYNNLVEPGRLEWNFNRL